MVEEGRRVSCLEYRRECRGFKEVSECQKTAENPAHRMAGRDLGRGVFRKLRRNTQNGEENWVSKRKISLTQRKDFTALVLK